MNIKLQEHFNLTSPNLCHEIHISIETFILRITQTLTYNTYPGMSGALDGTEKNEGQKLGHPKLVQPMLILHQKMEK